VKHSVLYFQVPEDIALRLNSPVIEANQAHPFMTKVNN